ncbi:hypothetical protein BD310DRAFT_82695 [Dichomitus squalens]|uniref:Uncharacterized protein n=1 Tax=Dichomitus squalens TaxID=114155 RepID=A0A4V2K712_9APHY|nr:hypothetical protein BD310DRAFT_82695 [Dichomitus squalens]
MWLLNTARAELAFFPTPESVPGGYTILSHVWGKDETTFQDIQNLRAKCAQLSNDSVAMLPSHPSPDNAVSSINSESPTKQSTIQASRTGNSDAPTDLLALHSHAPVTPRDLVSGKIRNFCILAEKHGHKWAWVDTCCIDKTSSAELTEAINSMYRYYSLADVCYAYLHDVPTSSVDVLEQPGSAFRKSRWHRRGWTLQELIAPELVVFLSQSWELLGTKADLAPLLESITRVPVGVLQLDNVPADYCIAARMAWAADRETTRPEDEAYCLMGIFGIFMPAIYGEGRNAFRKLQEEIMKQSEDGSIFAWGRVCNGEPQLEHEAGLRTQSPQFIDSVFAPSPSAFVVGHDIEYRYDEITIAKKRTPWYYFKARKRDQELPLGKQPTFTITPYGLQAHIPVFQLEVSSWPIIVAVLLGIRLKGSKARSLGLVLKPDEANSDPTRPRYVPWEPLARSQAPRFGHLTLLDFHHRMIGAHAGTQGPVEWKTIYIAHHSQSSRYAHTTGMHELNRSLHSPFRIPLSHIRELQKHQYRYDLIPRPLSFPWTGEQPMELTFLCREHEHMSVEVYLGVCSSEAPGAHWAIAVSAPSNLRAKDIPHICSQHHVDDWPNQTRVFTIIPRGAQGHVDVRLAFQLSHLNHSTRDMHIDFAVFL